MVGPTPHEGQKFSARFWIFFEIHESLLPRHRSRRGRLAPRFVLACQVPSRFAQFPRSTPCFSPPRRRGVLGGAHLRRFAGCSLGGNPDSSAACTPPRLRRTAPPPPAVQQRRAPAPANKARRGAGWTAPQGGADRHAYAAHAKQRGCGLAGAGAGAGTKPRGPCALFSTTTTSSSSAVIQRRVRRRRRDAEVRDYVTGRR